MNHISLRRKTFLWWCSNCFWQSSLQVVQLPVLWIKRSGDYECGLFLQFRLYSLLNVPEWIFMIMCIVSVETFGVSSSHLSWSNRWKRGDIRSNYRGVNVFRPRSISQLLWCLIVWFMWTGSKFNGRSPSGFLMDSWETSLKY